MSPESGFRNLNLDPKGQNCLRSDKTCPVVNNLRLIVSYDSELDKIDGSLRDINDTFSRIKLKVRRRIIYQHVTLIENELSGLDRRGEICAVCIWHNSGRK